MGSGNLSCLIRKLIKCTSAWFPKNRSEDTFHRISRRGMNIIRQVNIFRKAGFLAIIFLCWSDFLCCFFVAYGSIMCNEFHLRRVRALSLVVVETNIFVVKMFPKKVGGWHVDDFRITFFYTRIQK